MTIELYDVAKELPPKNGYYLARTTSGSWISMDYYCGHFNCCSENLDYELDVTHWAFIPTDEELGVAECSTES